MSYTIRTMKLQDLALAIEWAAAEGWNPGRDDLKSFYAADPNGFFTGELDGKPVATISAVAYNKAYGFIGFYIVHPEFRGRGYGKAIWDHAIAYLGSRTMGLDGVVAQQDNYRRSGFVLAYRNSRYRGVGPTRPTERPEEERNEIINARLIPFPQLRDFDRHYFPAGRDAFLSHWLKQPDAVALAHVKNDVMDGYGMIRPSREGWRIGPLFAQNERAARILFEELTSRAKDAPYFIDVPEANPAAVALAKHHGLESVFDTARMYRGEAPQLDLKGLYGVTSLELG